MAEFDFDFDSFFGPEFLQEAVTDTSESNALLNDVLRLKKRIILTDELLRKFNETLKELDGVKKEKYEYSKELQEVRQRLISHLTKDNNWERKCSELNSMLISTQQNLDLHENLVQARDSAIRQYASLVKEQEGNLKKLNDEIQSLKNNTDKSEEKALRKKYNETLKRNKKLNEILDKQQNCSSCQQLKSSVKKGKKQINKESDLDLKLQHSPASAVSVSVCSVDTGFGSNLSDSDSEFDTSATQKIQERRGLEKTDCVLSSENTDLSCVKERVSDKSCEVLSNLSFVNDGFVVKIKVGDNVSSKNITEPASSDNFAPTLCNNSNNENRRTADKYVQTFIVRKADACVGVHNEVSSKSVQTKLKVRSQSVQAKLNESESVETMRDVLSQHVQTECELVSKSVQTNLVPAECAPLVFVEAATGLAGAGKLPVCNKEIIQYDVGCQTIVDYTCNDISFPTNSCNLSDVDEEFNSNLDDETCMSVMSFDFGKEREIGGKNDSNMKQAYSSSNISDYKYCLSPVPSLLTPIPSPFIEDSSVRSFEMDEQSACDSPLPPEYGNNKTVTENLFSYNDLCTKSFVDNTTQTEDAACSCYTSKVVTSSDVAVQCGSSEEQNLLSSSEQKVFKTPFNKYAVKHKEKEECTTEIKSEPNEEAFWKKLVLWLISNDHSNGLYKNSIIDMLLSRCNLQPQEASLLSVLGFHTGFGQSRMGQYFSEGTPQNSHYEESKVFDPLSTDATGVKPIVVEMDKSSEQMAQTKVPPFCNKYQRRVHSSEKFCHSSCVDQKSESRASHKRKAESTKFKYVKTVETSSFNKSAHGKRSRKAKYHLSKRRKTQLSSQEQVASTHSGLFTVSTFASSASCSEASNNTFSSPSSCFAHGQNHGSIESVIDKTVNNGYFCRSDNMKQVNSPKGSDTEIGHVLSTVGTTTNTSVAVNCVQSHVSPDSSNIENCASTANLQREKDSLQDHSAPNLENTGAQMCLPVFNTEESPLEVGSETPCNVSRCQAQSNSELCASGSDNLENTNELLPLNSYSIFAPEDSRESPFMSTIFDFGDVTAEQEREEQSLEKFRSEEDISSIFSPSNVRRPSRPPSVHSCETLIMPDCDNANENTRDAFYFSLTSDLKAENSNNSNANDNKNEDELLDAKICKEALSSDNSSTEPQMLENSGSTGVLSVKANSDNSSMSSVEPPCETARGGLESAECSAIVHDKFTYNNAEKGVELGDTNSYVQSKSIHSLSESTVGTKNMQWNVPNHNPTHDVHTMDDKLINKTKPQTTPVPENRDHSSHSIFGIDSDSDGEEFVEVTQEVSKSQDSNAISCILGWDAISQTECSSVSDNDLNLKVISETENSTMSVITSKAKPQGKDYFKHHDVDNNFTAVATHNVENSVVPKESFRSKQLSKTKYSSYSRQDTPVDSVSSESDHSKEKNSNLNKISKQTEAIQKVERAKNGVHSELKCHNEAIPTDNSLNNAIKDSNEMRVDPPEKKNTSSKQLPAQKGSSYRKYCQSTIKELITVKPPPASIEINRKRQVSNEVKFYGLRPQKKKKADPENTVQKNVVPNIPRKVTSVIQPLIENNTSAFPFCRQGMAGRRKTITKPVQISSSSKKLDGSIDSSESHTYCDLNRKQHRIAHLPKLNVEPCTSTEDKALADTLSPNKESQPSKLIVENSAEIEVKLKPNRKSTTHCRPLGKKTKLQKLKQQCVKQRVRFQSLDVDNEVQKPLCHSVGKKQELNKSTEEKSCNVLNKSFQNITEDMALSDSDESIYEKPENEHFGTLMLETCSKPQSVVEEGALLNQINDSKLNPGIQCPSQTLGDEKKFTNDVLSYEKNDDFCIISTKDKHVVAIELTETTVKPCSKPEDEHPDHSSPVKESQPSKLVVEKSSTNRISTTHSRQLVKKTKHQMQKQQYVKQIVHLQSLDVDNEVQKFSCHSVGNNQELDKSTEEKCCNAPNDSTTLKDIMDDMALSDSDESVNESPKDENRESFLLETSSSKSQETAFPLSQNSGSKLNSCAKVKNIQCPSQRFSNEGKFSNDVLPYEGNDTLSSITKKGEHMLAVTLKSAVETIDKVGCKTGSQSCSPATEIDCHASLEDRKNVNKAVERSNLSDSSDESSSHSNENEFRAFSDVKNLLQCAKEKESDQSDVDDSLVNSMVLESPLSPPLECDIERNQVPVTIPTSPQHESAYRIAEDAGNNRNVLSGLTFSPHQGPKDEEDEGETSEENDCDMSQKDVNCDSNSSNIRSKLRSWDKMNFNMKGCQDLNILQEYFENYYKYEKKKKKKSQMLQHRIAKKTSRLESLLDTYIDSEFTEDALSDALESCKEIAAGDYGEFVKIIVRYCKLSSDENYDYSNSFPLTPIQQRLFTLIMKLKNHHPTIVNEVLERIQHVVCNIKHHRYMSTLFCLSRFFTAFCKLRNDKCRAQIFCYDALYCLKRKAYPVLFGLLTAFPEAFPKADSKASESPIVQTMVLVILMYGDSNITATKNLRTYLTQFYEYKRDDFATVENVLKRVIADIKCGTTSEVEQAILLLAKFKTDWAWTHGKLIKGCLLETIDNWQQGKGSDKAAALCIKLSAYLAKTPPYERDDVLSLMTSIQSLLTSNTSTFVIKEACIFALATLVQMNDRKVFFILKACKSEGYFQKSQELKDALNNVMKRRTEKWWRTFLNMSR